MAATPQKLISIDKGLWCLNTYFLSLGCKGSLRMTILTSDSGLLLYSPVHLEPEMLETIRALGNVEALIAPNLFHHLYLREAIHHFPKARILVPDGLEAKIGPIDGAVSVIPQALPDLGSDIEVFSFSGHKLRETLLYQKSTRTLVTADMLYNYQDEQYMAEKLFFRLIGCYGKPDLAFYHRFSIEDKNNVRALIKWVRARDIRRLVMCHGQIFEQKDAAHVFADAWERFAS